MHSELVACDGDLFREDIDLALASGLTMHGDAWGLWGRSVVERPDDEDGQIVGLFSRTFSGERRAYALRLGYEQIVEKYQFEEKRNHVSY